MAALTHESIRANFLPEDMLRRQQMANAAQQGERNPLAASVANDNPVGPGGEQAALMRSMIARLDAIERNTHARERRQSQTNERREGYRSPAQEFHQRARQANQQRQREVMQRIDTLREQAREQVRERARQRAANQPRDERGRFTPATSRPAPARNQPGPQGGHVPAGGQNVPRRPIRSELLGRIGEHFREEARNDPRIQLAMAAGRDAKRLYQQFRSRGGDSQGVVTDKPRAPIKSSPLQRHRPTFSTYATVGPLGPAAALGQNTGPNSVGIGQAGTASGGAGLSDLLLAGAGGAGLREAFGRFGSRAMGALGGLARFAPAAARFAGPVGAAAAFLDSTPAGEGSANSNPFEPIMPDSPMGQTAGTGAASYQGGAGVGGNIGTPTQAEGNREVKGLIDYTPGSITNAMGIEPEQWSAFRRGVASIENPNRYDTMGGSAKVVPGGRFAGRYQMGGDEIAAVAKSLGETAPLRTVNGRTIGNEEFLNDPQRQERYFERFTQMNHEYLTNSSAAYRAMSPQAQLETLGYAHNQGGPATVRFLETGAVGRDAFGTAGNAYNRAVRNELTALEQGNMPSGLAPTNPQVAAGATPGASPLVTESQGKNARIRNDPIQANLRDQLQFAAERTGVEVEVGSGGQMSLAEAQAAGAVRRGKDWYLNGQPVRTGSTRHDHGGAADVRLYQRNPQTGERRLLDMSNRSDAATMEAFTRETVRAGATGVGAGPGYMGNSTLHIGGGKEASWGGASWVERARAAGSQGREEGQREFAAWQAARAEQIAQGQEVAKPTQVAENFHPEHAGHQHGPNGEELGPPRNNPLTGRPYNREIGQTAHDAVADRQARLAAAAATAVTPTTIPATTEPTSLTPVPVAPVTRATLPEPATAPVAPTTPTATAPEQSNTFDPVRWVRDMFAPASAVAAEMAGATGSVGNAMEAVKDGLHEQRQRMETPAPRAEPTTPPAPESTPVTTPVAPATRQPETPQALGGRFGDSEPVAVGRDALREQLLQQRGPADGRGGRVGRVQPAPNPDQFGPQSSLGVIGSPASGFAPTIAPTQSAFSVQMGAPGMARPTLDPVTGAPVVQVASNLTGAAAESVSPNTSNPISTPEQPQTPANVGTARSMGDTGGRVGSDRGAAAAEAPAAATVTTPNHTPVEFGGLAGGAPAPLPTPRPPRQEEEEKLRITEVNTMDEISTYMVNGGETV